MGQIIYNIVISFCLTLVHQSSDVRSLLGRSLARAKTTHYTDALADAAKATGKQSTVRVPHSAGAL